MALDKYYRGVGWVYFISWSADSPVKIGFSTDPTGRLAALQTSHPYRLYVEGVIEGSYEDEQSLHYRFKKSRLEGEWFRRGPKLNGLIAGALKEWWPIDQDDYKTCSPVCRKGSDIGGRAGDLYEVRDEDGGFYFKTVHRVVADQFCSMMAGKKQSEARRGAMALLEKGLTAARFSNTVRL